MAAENTNTSTARSMALPIPLARPPPLATVARPHPPQDAVQARDGVRRTDPKTPGTAWDAAKQARLDPCPNAAFAGTWPGWVAGFDVQCVYSMVCWMMTVCLNFEEPSPSLVL
uniref:Uncharacterized protein n=1 Tax=Oryza sativa subsp. japonica TaxID=39947 RepID=Q10C18_ORYSJ|nr:hypothetical protein LOC_Os03g58364 [Oryza sativa Japonica Group]